MNKKITIYITNHNYQKYLYKSIESALNQTYKNIEIIVVDDSSTDNSKIILNYFKKNFNIKVFFNTKKKGLVKSCIKAINNSTGQYILRLDPDDILMPEACKTLLKKIYNKKNVGFVFSDFYEYFEKKKKISRFYYKHKKKYLISDVPAHGACSLISKKIYQKLGGYNDLFDRQDGFYLWILMIINNYKIVHCKSPLFLYRKHDKNLSNNLIKILKTKKKIIDYFIKQKLNNLDDLKKLKKIIKKRKI